MKRQGKIINIILFRFKNDKVINLNYLIGTI